MTREMDIALRTMSHIIKQDLGLGAFKQQTRQCLTIALKEDRKKSRCLLLYGEEHSKENLFTDEKNVYCGGNFQLTLSFCLMKV